MTRNTRRLVLTVLFSGLVPAVALAADHTAAASPAAGDHHAASSEKAPVHRECTCSRSVNMGGSGAGAAARQATPRTDPALERELDRLRSRPG